MIVIFHWSLSLTNIMGALYWFVVYLVSTLLECLGMNNSSTYCFLALAGLKLRKRFDVIPENGHWNLPFLISCLLLYESNVGVSEWGPMTTCPIMHGAHLCKMHICQKIHLCLVSFIMRSLNLRRLLKIRTPIA